MEEDEVEEMDERYEHKGEHQNLIRAMNDKRLVNRYSKYLNKCLFNTSDAFLRRKHNQYLDSIGFVKEETVYDRMQRDCQRRVAKHSNHQPVVPLSPMKSPKGSIFG